jgi:hypothetical protein
MSSWKAPVERPRGLIKIREEVKSGIIALITLENVS